MSRGRKPVTQCTRAEWRAMCSRMRSVMPPPDGYDWRFLWVEARAGDARSDIERNPVCLHHPTARRRGIIIVRVERGQSEAATAECLIHEVAHAFDIWTHHAFAGDHSATWGVWYARTYCQFWGVS